MIQTADLDLERLVGLAPKAKARPANDLDALVALAPRKPKPPDKLPYGRSVAVPEGDYSIPKGGEAQPQASEPETGLLSKIPTLSDASDFLIGQVTGRTNKPGSSKALGVQDAIDLPLEAVRAVPELFSKAATAYGAGVEAIAGEGSAPKVITDTAEFYRQKEPTSLGGELGRGLGTVGAMVGAPALAGAGRAAALTAGATMGGVDQGVTNWHAAGGAKGGDKAFRALMSGFGVGAAGVLVPLERVNKITKGAFGNLLADSAIFGGSASIQSSINDVLLENITQEELPVLSRAIDAGAFGALTGVLASGLAHVAMAKPTKKSAKVGESEPTANPLEKGPVPEVTDKGPEPVDLSPAIKIDEPSAKIDTPDAEQPSAGLPAAEQQASGPALHAADEPKGETAQAVPRSSPSRGINEDLSAAPSTPAELPKGAKPEMKAESPTPENVTNTIGMRFESMDADRAARGAEPVSHAERITEQGVLEKAAKAFEQDSDVGKNLVDELAASPREMNTDEQGVMVREMVRLEKARDLADADLSRARDVGDSEMIGAAERVVKAAQARYELAQEMTGQSSSRKGQAFRMLQIQLTNDYSRAATEQRFRKANKGADLSPAQKKQAEELSARVSKLEGDIAELQAGAAAEHAQALRREVRARQRTPGAIEKFVTAKADEARARLSSHIARDPLGVSVIEDVAIIGAEKIVKGAATLEHWSKLMVEDLGEWVKPHLADVYEKAKLAATDLSTEGETATKQDAANKRTESAIGKIWERIAYEDFAARDRKKTPLNERGIELQAELERARREIRVAAIRQAREHRTGGQKARDAVVQVKNAQTAIKSAYDLSAVLRQAGKATASHPIRAVKAMPEMLRAFRSAASAERQDQRLRSRSNYTLGKRSGLELTELDSTLGKQEEAIRSDWAEKIPGINASNRSFITFLNTVRANNFDALVASAIKTDGKIPPARAKALADYVNITTGRGVAAGKFQAALNAATFAIWSPRLLLSQLQFVSGRPLWGGDAVSRRLILKEYARVAAGYGVLHMLGQLVSDENENVDNPTSSDFGKIIRGNTRIDLWGGMQQPLVLEERIRQGKTTSISGKETPIRGDDVPFVAPTATELGWKFVRTKFTPWLGLSADLLDDENVIGEKPSEYDPDLPLWPEGKVGYAAKNMVAPLPFDTLYEAIKDRGVPEGTALWIVGQLGGGVSTYGPREPKKKIPSRIADVIKRQREAGMNDAANELEAKFK